MSLFVIDRPCFCVFRLEERFIKMRRRQGTDAKEVVYVHMTGDIDIGTLPIPKEVLIFCRECCSSLGS
jgi:hypothetical protein